MRIPLTEPISPRYIYINEKTNQIHLMVPIVGGQEISTDNTYASTKALKRFFKSGALRELIAYQNALALDIALMKKSDPEEQHEEMQCTQQQKIARLTQIEIYIRAVSAMQHHDLALMIGDVTAIQQKFERNYRTVTTTQENPHMDEKTKRAVLRRVTEMERIDMTTNKPAGLKYRQNDNIHHSAHFDLTPLKQALQQYIHDYHTWGVTTIIGIHTIKQALMKVGRAQRDIPAHVAQEYCRQDRTFDPLPEFQESHLPRGLVFFNCHTGKHDALFPLSSSAQANLGFNFALMRGAEKQAVGLREENHEMLKHWWGDGVVDFKAITHLDAVRTGELTLLHEYLSSSTSCSPTASSCKYAF